MRIFKLAVVCTVLAGCAPVETADLAGPACRSGFAPLRFAEGRASLEPGFARALQWSAEMASECEITSLRVTGLPEPSPETLEGRRAQAVVAVTQGFGLPAPTFDLGDTEAQDSPQLEIDAVPRRGVTAPGR